MTDSKYLIALFLEGFLVISLELSMGVLGGAIFGQSIYVWLISISLGMLGMGSGYLLSTIVKFQPGKIFLFSGFLFGIIPVLAEGLSFFLWEKIQDPVIGMLIFGGILSLPLFILLALVPPSFAEIPDAYTGKKLGAGSAFGVSSLGGISACLIVGLGLLPLLGVKKIFLVLVFICLISTLLFLYNFTKKDLIPVLSVCLTIFILSYWNPLKKTSTVKEIARSDGVWGQIVVGEFDYQNGSSSERVRSLFVNGMPQTMVSSDKGTPIASQYSEILGRIIKQQRPGNSCVVGLGGGGVLPFFKEFYGKITAVELEQKVIDYSRQYFSNLSEGLNIKYVRQDGRAFLQRTSESYDLILLDVTKGEMFADYLFTREALALYQKKLSSNGILVLNVLGKIQGSHSGAVQSIMKTMNTVFKEGIVFTVGNQNNTLLCVGPGTNRLVSANLGLAFYPFEDVLDQTSLGLVDGKDILYQVHYPLAKFTRRWYLQNFPTPGLF